MQLPLSWLTMLSHRPDCYLNRVHQGGIDPDWHLLTTSLVLVIVSFFYELWFLPLQVNAFIVLSQHQTLFTQEWPMAVVIAEVDKVGNFLLVPRDEVLHWYRWQTYRHLHVLKNVPHLHDLTNWLHLPPCICTHSAIRFNLHFFHLLLECFSKDPLHFPLHFPLSLCPHYFTLFQRSINSHCPIIISLRILFLPFQSSSSSHYLL